ncbi:MAG: CAP domain-containing protein [Anaerolineae bacterium]
MTHRGSPVRPGRRQVAALLLALVMALSGSVATATVAARPPVSHIYLPIVERSLVDVYDRESSRRFYLQNYLASEGIACAWSGNHAACQPGATSQTFRDAVLRRIGYFRAMAGVPAVTLNDTYDQQAQAAALMMSANRQLNHAPPTSWQCYSAVGAEGAGTSNLYLGVYGPSAITGYMRDPGSGNYAAGHRRWILYPNTQEMGTGDVPAADGYPAANALRVFDDHMWDPRPATREEYVAWPPPGYVPYQVVFARWSFALPNADFGAATVRMSANGADIPVSVSPIVDGYGDNTLLWVPMGLGDGAVWPCPSGDTRYRVTVGNVRVDGATRTFTYDVVVFDPGS